MFVVATRCELSRLGTYKYRLAHSSTQKRTGENNSRKYCLVHVNHVVTWWLAQIQKYTMVEMNDKILYFIAQVDSVPYRRKYKSLLPPRSVVYARGCAISAQSTSYGAMNLSTLTGKFVVLLA